MIETVSEREREEQSGREHESRGIFDWRRNAKYHCPLYIQEHNLTKLLAHSDLLPPRGRHRLVSHSRVRRRYFASSSLPSPRAFSPSEPPLRRLRRRRRCGAHDYSALISLFSPFPTCRSRAHVHETLAVVSIAIRIATGLIRIVVGDRERADSRRK